METAVILAEGYLGTNTGKTANGLVRYSRRFRIVGVLDSHHAGRDAGEVVAGTACGIPVFANLPDALNALPERPSNLIVGVATFGGYLPPEFRSVVRGALGAGMTVVSGLHEYLGEDPELSALAREKGARIVDVRRPRPLQELRQFSDRARHLPCLRIPIVGTDGSIGKRTTALLLTDALNAAGVRATFVATGQTGLLQGAEFGVPLDAIRGDFMVGELEAEIVRAHEATHAQVLVIEGQGSLSHPGYVCGTRAILSASAPSGFVLVHAPGRTTRNYRREQLALPMPDTGREIALLETLARARLPGIAFNPEGLAGDDIVTRAREHSEQFRVPAFDPLVEGCDGFVKAVRSLI